MNLEARIFALLGEATARVERLHGGDLSEVWRVHLAGGCSLVVKVAETVPAEARMLKELSRAGAPAPRVLAIGDGLLAMTDLGPDEGPGAAWADLGQVLRRLHDNVGDAYGWTEDHAFGQVPIPNGPTADWPAFWAERRLLPSCAVIPVELARRMERLAASLPDRLPPTPQPALLHGDLWAGNVMARGGRVTGLIDPACYHGDAEVDLAMLHLFGGPGPAFAAAYGALVPGWRARRPIYQLWPALVHLRLFGAGYRRLVERCLDAAGA